MNRRLMHYILDGYNTNRTIRRLVDTREMLELHRNAKLKLTSRPGETLEEFTQRCDLAAQDAADAETAKIRDRLEARQDRLESALAQAQHRVEELSLDERTRQTNELAAGAGAILGALLQWREVALAVDTVTIRPESADVGVDRLALVWVAQQE
jgi:vacuolar-type H+-ATPase subunit E/Vma4